MELLVHFWPPSLPWPRRDGRHRASRKPDLPPSVLGTCGRLFRYGKLSPVLLDIDREDERGFHAAREILLGRFARWLAGEDPSLDEEIDELVGDASIPLDWKWSHGDGALAMWRTSDVAEFLLEWCPRQLSVTQADCITIPLAVAAFLSFLDDEALLGPGSDPVDRLTEVAVSLTEEFVVAMGDRSRFGLGKSLYAAAVDEGVDATDADEFQQWIGHFNDRPEEERHRLLPDSAFSGPRRSLPAVAVPAEDDVAASREAAPILAMFRDLAAYVGAGRKLTQKGNLTLADARALVDLLGTGDLMDEQIGDQTFRTTSSDDLYRLRQVFAWAKKAGVVRVIHGKVVATKHGARLADGLGGSFDRAVDALMALGPLTSQRFPNAWFAWPDVDKVLDKASAHLLIAPYGAQGPVSLEDIATTATRVVLDAFEFQMDDEGVARRVTSDVTDIMDAFELAGVVRRIGTGDSGDNLRRRGGSVALTPAGIVFTRGILAAAGYDTPVAGRFANAGAADLLRGTDGDDFSVIYGEAMAWRAVRQPDEAAAEMAEAVREVDDPALQNLGLAILSEIGPDVAAPYVRELASEPGTRGFALCWLVDHGEAGEEELFDPSDVAGFVDVLGCRMVTGGPDSLVSTLALAGDHGRQVEVVAGMWRTASPMTDLVLTGVSRVHPTKVVAKAARKALFKRRSSSGVT